MTFLRPATPGFIVTLVATILLVVVVFCVPYFKSIYFLKASVTVQSVTGNITFGTLGYCVELPSNTTCSKPSIGYALDINGLVGNNLPVQIPQVVVKWITYALFLHVIALVGAAASAVFGLLAHVREMSMACCSTCISGFAAVVTLIAFIFDLVLFFVAKARISKIGSASIGTAIWLTLAAWVLLFFSGCFYTLGRCCLSGRPSLSLGGKRDNEGGPDKGYSEQMRLDAVKAEADRKARQKMGESGLPAFYETQPLTGHVEGDQVYLDGDRSDTKSQADLSLPRKQSYKGGYAPGAVGSRSVDDYYNQSDSTLVAASYPPQPQQGPRRQRSEPSNYDLSGNSPSPQGAGMYAAGYGQYHSSGDNSSNHLLAPPGINPGPYGHEYYHSAGGSSYHSAVSHDQGPTVYAPYEDPYASYYTQPSQYSQPMFNPETYNSISLVTHSPPPMPLPGTTNTSTGYNPPMPTSPPQQLPQLDRSYTLSGDGYGYGSNQLPPLPDEVHNTSPPLPSLPPPSLQTGYHAYSQPGPIDTGYSAPQSEQTSPVKGPRPQPGFDDAPPGYETSSTGATGHWGKR